MNIIISDDLLAALSNALSADPVTVLLPLAIVAIAQGLRAGGVGEVFAKAWTGLAWLGLLHVLLQGLLSRARFDPGMWRWQFGKAWDDLLGLRVMEILGFWLLLLAGIMLIFVIRSLLRR